MTQTNTSAHNLFAEALVAYSQGDRNPFILIDHDEKQHPYNLASRFRSFSKLNQIEKGLIIQSQGRILDVGCGSGNMLASLAKYGSPVVNRYCKRMRQALTAEGVQLFS